MATKDVSDYQVLCAVEEATKNSHSEWSYDILERETGECTKVCYRALERAHRNGLIDYGVSLRTAWITEEGKKFLEEVQRLTDEAKAIISE